MMKFALVPVIATMALTGCTTYRPQPYAVSVETIQTLRAYRGQTTIAVGIFTATEPGRDAITCRAAGPVRTPTGVPFEAFIRQAFIDELTIAEVFGSPAPVTLTGHLNSIDFSSWAGSWTISFTLRSSTGREITLLEVYSFSMSLVGDAACTNAGHALSPAVQALVGRFVRHPEFPAMLRAGP
jgi:hypothetical protein